MKNDDENLEFFDFDSAVSKVGTIIMFGTLIFFFNHKINSIKKSEFKFQNLSKDNVDVDSRVLVKLSCLTNIGLDDLARKKNRKYFKFFTSQICSIVKLFIGPILDIIEILRMSFEFIRTSKSVSLNFIDKHINENHEVSYNIDSSIRKVKSCVVINFSSEEKKEDSNEKQNVKDNNSFYKKCILELMKIKDDGLSISSLLNETGTCIKTENYSNFSSLTSSNESSRCSSLKGSTKQKSNNLIKYSGRVKDVLKKEKFKNIQKPKDCLIEKKREKIGNKKVLNITDSIIQNVALNVCSDEDEEVSFVQISNFKSNIYNGKLKFGS